MNSGGAIMPGGNDATPIIMDELQVMALIQESGDAKIIAVPPELFYGMRRKR